MTTPRDDIAGLIERLRKWNDEWPHWKFTAHQHDALRLVLDYSEQAATQLDSLSARVKELEEDITEIPQLLRRAEARALRLQQERDEAVDLLRQMTDDSIDDALYPFAECFDVARDLVRRLAGPEKEGE